MGNSASSSANTAAAGSSRADDAACRSKLIDTLRFVARSEETRLMARTNGGPSFIKDYPAGTAAKDDGGDAADCGDDWKGNHYLQQKIKKKAGKKDKDSARYEVIVSSYQLDLLEEKYGVVVSVPSYSTTTTSSKKETILVSADGFTKPPPPPPTPQWLKLERPSGGKRPDIPDGESKLRDFLDWFRMDQNLPDGTDLGGDVRDRLDADVVSRLQQQGDVDSEILDFLTSDLNYKMEEELKPLYKKLFNWQATYDPEDSELVWGFGHVRMVSPVTTVTTKKNTKGRNIVNGPLFEVIVEAKQQEDGSITVSPRNDARLKLNDEVMHALTTTGAGGNTEVIKKLRQLVEEERDPESLSPRNPESYVDILEAARNLRWNGVLKQINDPATHEPPNDPDGAVFNGAWCLYSRSKTSSVYSRDAVALAEALEDGKLNIPKSAYELTKGPGRGAPDSKINCPKHVDELPLPLPASATQKQIIHKLFVEKSPVVVVEGPPGTGKSHTSANCSLVGVSKGLSVLITSRNSKALEATVEKLPPNLRRLCVDMSSLNECGMKKFLKSLEAMLIDSKAKGQQDRYEMIQQQMRSKKEALSKIDLDFESAITTNRRLFEDDKVKLLVTRALEWGIEKTPSIKIAITSKLKDIESVLEKIRKLSVEQKAELGVSFDYDDEVSEDLLELAWQRSGGASASQNTVFKFVSDSSEMKSMLSKLKVDGKSPASREDWSRIYQGLRLKKLQGEVQHALAAMLCCGDQKIDSQNGVANCKGTEEKLQRARECKEAVKKLKPDDRKHLEKLIASSANFRALQDDRRKLATEIEGLESELVFAKVMSELSKSLTPEARSKLNQLVQLVCKAKHTISSTSSGRAIRHHSDFVEKFKECVPYIPLLVMDTEHASTYLPSDHSFGLVILDEASQSDCTAMNIMVRSTQLLVVGDDKQVSPTESFWSEGNIADLRENLPNIPAAQGLLPGKSFFDLCKVAFPDDGSHVFLREHFRCSPDIAAFSNDQMYDRRLQIFRLPSKTKALVSVRVDGEKDDKKKTNEAECDKIVKFVCDEIKKAAAGKLPPRTIGIISMGGPQQSKYIETSLNNKLDALDLCCGAHNVMVGEPSHFQGAERDIIYMSTVYGPSYIHPESFEDRYQQWNVAMTRSKEKLVLVHSFKMNDIKKNDIKRTVLSHFLNHQIASIPVIADKQRNLRGIQNKIQDLLISNLIKKFGFEVERMEGSVWSNGLCVGREGEKEYVRALVYVENCGETREVWAETLDQQMSLERAGHPCLRVDALSLALNFRSTFEEVLAFLAEAGLQKSSAAPQSHARGTNAVSDLSDDSESAVSSPVAERKRRDTRPTTRSSKKLRIDDSSDG